MIENAGRSRREMCPIGPQNDPNMITTFFENHNNDIPKHRHTKSGHKNLNNDCEYDYGYPMGIGSVLQYTKIFECYDA